MKSALKLSEVKRAGAFCISMTSAATTGCLLERFAKNVVSKYPPCVGPGRRPTSLLGGMMQWARRNLHWATSTFPRLCHLYKPRSTFSHACQSSLQHGSLVLIEDDVFHGDTNVNADSPLCSKGCSSEEQLNSLFNDVWDCWECVLNFLLEFIGDKLLKYHFHEVTSFFRAATSSTRPSSTIP